MLRSLGDNLTQASAEKLWNGGQANYQDTNTFAQAAMDATLSPRLPLLSVAWEPSVNATVLRSPMALA